MYYTMQVQIGHVLCGINIAVVLHMIVAMAITTCNASKIHVINTEREREREMLLRAVSHCSKTELSVIRMVPN